MYINWAREKCTIGLEKMYNWARKMYNWAKKCTNWARKYYNALKIYSDHGKVNMTVLKKKIFKLG